MTNQNKLREEIVRVLHRDDVLSENAAENMSYFILGAFQRHIESSIPEIEKDFIGSFDIERIKDRTQHEYVEGNEAEERVKSFLITKLKNILK
jgi:hypothetical protein